MNQKAGAPRAFTLIELLIVVAIIAILAAIAVPNFLEAQTRAKVARVQSDMRSVSVALESYAVDTNKIMTMIAPNPRVSTINGGSVFGISGSGTGYVSSRLIRLTTPIAYLSSVPRDGFINQNVGVALAPPQGLTPAPEYDGYDYVSGTTFVTGGNPFGDTTNRAAGISSGAGWHLVSAGPDRINCFGGGNVGSTGSVCGWDYDATNGSISTGDIVRIGGGPGPLFGVLPTVDRIQNRYN